MIRDRSEKIGSTSFVNGRRLLMAAVIVIAGAASSEFWGGHQANAQEITDNSALGAVGATNGSGGAASTSSAPANPTPIANNTKMDPLINSVTASSSYCWVCRFIDDLSVQADTYAAQISSQVASAAYTTWNAVLLCGIIWYFLMVLVTGKIDLSSILMKAATAIACTYVLKVSQKGASSWFWTQIYTPLRDSTAKFATAMVTGGGFGTGANIQAPTQWQSLCTSCTGPQSGPLTPPYSTLFGSIEHAILGVILNAWSIVYMKTDGLLPDIVVGIINVVCGLIIMVPFIVIFTIFGAYIIESMFAFLAVNCVMPLLFICFFFEKTRGFVWIGLRIMLGAGLTLVFAGIAMGFTISAVMKYQVDLMVAIVNGGSYIVAQMPYWIMLFIGLMSIILHLKAKTLATNFSGASDGAGPAAAVASLVGGGIGMLAKGGIGRVGGAMGGGATRARQGLFGKSSEEVRASSEKAQMKEQNPRTYGAAGAAARTAGQWIRSFQNRR